QELSDCKEGEAVRSGVSYCKREEWVGLAVSYCTREESVGLALSYCTREEAVGLALSYCTREESFISAVVRDPGILCVSSEAIEWIFKLSWELSVRSLSKWTKQ